jgi:Domain of unknown function (DUF4326)
MPNHIRVANLRAESIGFRCDHKSSLSNPFVLLRGDEGGRDRVIKAYGIYLHQIANEGLEPIDAIEYVQSVSKHHLLVSSSKPLKRWSFIDELAAIEECYDDYKPVTLLCWCAPLACHCDRIAAFLRWRYPDI